MTIKRIIEIHTFHAYHLTATSFVSSTKKYLLLLFKFRHVSIKQKAHPHEHIHSHGLDRELIM